MTTWDAQLHAGEDTDSCQSSHVRTTAACSAAHVGTLARGRQRPRRPRRHVILPPAAQAAGTRLSDIPFQLIAIPFRRNVPPGPMAASPVASARGGRRHVSAGEPAATTNVVLFDNLFRRWSFLPFRFSMWSVMSKFPAVAPSPSTPRTISGGAMGNGCSLSSSKVTSMQS